MLTIKESIFKRSNDYSYIQEKFEKTTGLTFITREQQEFDFRGVSESVSVVIPAYMGHQTLPITLQALEQQIYRNFEVIVIDDLSPETMENVVIQCETSFPIKFVRHNKNGGRSSSRNTGIALADGHTIVLMDQDMIPAKTHLSNFAVRQYYCHDCTLIGFKENINYSEWLVRKDANIGPNLEADWRYRLPIHENLIWLNLNGKKSNLDEDVYLLNQSDYLKCLGYGESIGYWDLPSLVVSHSWCFKKEAAVMAGGFLEIFSGWGGEDIALGASLIAHGQYVIPVLNCVSYHINHKRFSGSYEKQWEEFRKNLSIYLKWVNSPLEDIKFPQRTVKYLGKTKCVEFYETVIG